MLYNRTYLDKCATIVKGSNLNTGLNPVSELVYGRNNSRMLIYFNHERIKKMFEDKTFPDLSKMRHILNITNAGSLDLSQLHKVYGSQIDGAEKKRASSFDLIFFLIPKKWDNGKGFDYTRNYYNIDFYDPKSYDITNYISEDGVTWFKPRNGTQWIDKTDYQVTKDGQLSLYIKADRQTIGSDGGTVTFTYFCCANDTEFNRGLVFKAINPSADFPITVGDPVYYSASGQICNTEADIIKYCKYVKVEVKIPQNTLNTPRKYVFGLEYQSVVPVTATEFYIGSSSSPVITKDVFSKLTKFQVEDGEMTGTADTNYGDYIWFALPDEIEIENITSSGMPVSLMPGYEVIGYEGQIYKCYRTLNALDIASWKFNIEPKLFDFESDKPEYVSKKYKSNPYRIVQASKNETVRPICEDGIYSTDTLSKQLQLFEAGEDSIIIGKQHFDIGCENISLDITDTFNKFIIGELQNYGLGIAFSPAFEYDESNVENYVGLLTNRTNSFFEPYVESIYGDSIEDDRQNFVLGRKNKLYLYANIGGDLVNLDQLPTCTVDGTEYDVKQASKGIYYIEITLPQNAFTAPTMLYDKWDGIVYQGEQLNPVEMEFTTRSAQTFFQLGYQMPEKATFTPTCYGINDNERIKRGDVRKVCFLFKKDYAKNTGIIVDSVETRLYVMDGTAQVTVIPYIKTNRAFSDTYVMIDTSILIPNTYYMDVRVKYGMEMIEHHDVLHFKVVDEENNKYA